MSETVNRYDLSGYGGGMIEAEDGVWYHEDDYARLEQECDQHRNMAGCMDLFRKDMIEVGVVDESCSPMFKTEGVLGYIGKLKAERTTALSQAEAMRDLLTRCQEHLDPHRDAALWSDVCAALRPKP